MGRQRIARTAAALFLVLICWLTNAAAQQKTIRIGCVADGPWDRNDEVVAVFRQEILEITEGEFDVVFLTDETVVGDWTIAGITQAVDRIMADPEVDIVLALGTLVGIEVARRGTLPKPTIAPFIVDAELQGIPLTDGTSGVKNLSYLATPGSVSRDLRAFLEVTKFRRLAVLVNEIVLEGIPQIRARFDRVGRELNLEVTLVPLADSVPEALQAVPADAEAVYITPLMQFSGQQFDQLISGLNARRLPTFSLFGRMEVNRGVFAGVATADFFLRTARRVALNVQSVLLGDNAGSLPVSFSENARLAINMATARQIQVFPSFAVLTEAELINEGSRPDRVVSLVQSVQEAIAVNLDLAAEQYNVAAGAHAVGESRANLLPQVDLSARNVVIDKDRAGLTAAERTWSGSVSLTQLLFSEPAWAGYSIDKNLQLSRIHQREQLRLDIARDAAQAFLNVLRAKTFERVQKDNLNLTRSNLELARIRVNVGSSSRADLLRWENQIARNRISVIDAIAQRNQAELQVNRVLHRPVEESFDTQETSLTDPALLGIQDRLLPYMDNPWNFRRFRNFMVQVAMQNSPELKQFDAAIAAQNRARQSATRAFWLPSLALSADVSRRFSEGGEGSEDADFSGLDPSLAPLFSSFSSDDTDWSVGVQASLPLFSGGGRFSRRSGASEDLERLRLERRALAERIEQRVRSGLHAAGSSRAAIGLSAAAASAATENLELVTDSYSRGVYDIIDLIDAQNAALTSQLGAASSVYDYLVDWMEVERAAGLSLFLMSGPDIDRWFGELQKHFEAAGESR